MKKIYLSALLMGLSAGAFAQVSSQPYSFGANELNLKPVQQLPTEASAPKALGVEIWSNDFDNAADWTIDNDGQGGGAFGWSIDANSDGWYDPNGINSTSGGDFAELSNGDPTANPATQVLDVTYTLTTAVALDIPNLPLNTGNTDQVTLQYEEYGARFNDLQEVQISTDGGSTWTPIRNNLNYSVLSATGGSAYANPETISINLAPYITGNANNVMIRFSWTTNYPASATNPNVWIAYGWYIDDIKLFTNPDNDLEATVPYWGTEYLHYYQIPTTQVAPIDFSTNAFNNGTATQNNAMLNVDVDAGATFSGSSAAGVNVAPNTYDSLFLTTPWTPAASTATYNITWDISQDEVDDVPANNDNVDITMSVTDYIYARDMNSADGTQFNSGDGYEVGNLFDIWTDQEVKGVDIRLDNSTTVGSLVYAKIYSIDANTGDFVFEQQSDYHTITSANLNSVLTLELLAPLTLTNANLTYLVVACTDGDGGATDDVVIATSGESEPQTSFYFDATDATWYYTTNTPMVRLNFDPVIGLGENENVFGVNLYPNPATDAVSIDYNVANASDVTIELTDLSGKTIATINNTANAGANTVSFDTEALSNGVYNVVISTDNGTVTEKFIKK